MKDSRITVSFPADLRRRLSATARRSGTRESDLVRSAVESRLEASEVSPTAFDRLEKAGLIGMIRGLSPDLSTNVSHFDGFGRPACRPED